MGQFGDCKSVFFETIKNEVDWKVAESKLDLVCDCFEIFMDCQSMVTFFDAVLPSIPEYHTQAKRYVEEKIRIYNSWINY